MLGHRGWEVKEARTREEGKVGEAWASRERRKIDPFDIKYSIETISKLEWSLRVT